MKQFQRKSPTGQLYGPFDIDQARSMAYPLRGWLYAAEVGSTATDIYGDTWERLPDLVLQDDVVLQDDGEDVVLDTAVAKERLERIATAALQGLLAGSTANVVLMSELNKSGINPFPRLASDAHLAAKALIAELDKQS
jgi:hypothetical protein